MSHSGSNPVYGDGSASYQTAGGYPGIRQLVDHFYDYMETLPEAREILLMHPENLEESRAKLADFLSGWLGGPRVYQEKHGEIRLPMAHKHLKIDQSGRDAWLKCMTLALDKMSWPEEFKTYLLQQLERPAERIYQVSQKAHAS